MDIVLAETTEVVLALTHIAAVFWRGGAWVVFAMYPRNTPGLRDLHHSHWMFVPANVRLGDVILFEGVTVYADPVYAELYATEPVREVKP